MIPSLLLLAALLLGVCATSLSAVALAFAYGGLSPAIAWASLSIGAAVAGFAIFSSPPLRRQRSVFTFWDWAVTLLFSLFALRAFLWVVFIEGDEIKVLSPNNLGDLSLHLTYIREMANGVQFWPQNPIVAGAALTYPVGVDLFHSLCLLAGADLLRTFVWMGLFGSLLTGFALWKWGRAFTMAGFLFNGGLAGFAFFATWKIADFQSIHAWKSIPLALFVTQRGFLFAVPVGLLLLVSWRTRFFPHRLRKRSEEAEAPLPFWAECLLYASLPLFHLHTFLFFSVLLLAWFFVQRSARRQIAHLVLASFIPATLLVLCVTHHFQGPSIIGLQPGWMQDDPDFLSWCKETLTLSTPWLTRPLFWAYNFGALVVLAPLLVWRTLREPRDDWGRACAIPAATVFLICCFVKFAPWEWDNTKLMLWCYLLILPLLWERVLIPLSEPLRATLCFLLFFSGFISTFGGIDASHDGYGIALRSELDGLADGLRGIDPDARFLAQPDYNHPLLLLGHPLATGYAGHVNSHGYPWEEAALDVNNALDGVNGWQGVAAKYGCRYLFWGRRERAEHPDSLQPWEKDAVLLRRGSWGSIYDLAPEHLPTK